MYELVQFLLSSEDEIYEVPQEYADLMFHNKVENCIIDMDNGDVEIEMYEDLSIIKDDGGYCVIVGYDTYKDGSSLRQGMLEIYFDTKFNYKNYENALD